MSHLDTIQSSDWVSQTVSNLMFLVSQIINLLLFPKRIYAFRDVLKLTLVYIFGD